MVSSTPCRLPSLDAKMSNASVSVRQYKGGDQHLDVLRLSSMKQSPQIPTGSGCID